VVRKAMFVIMGETIRLLKTAPTPRKRVSAIIRANFPDGVFTRDVARAWVSFYAAIGQQREFERLQTTIDRRLQSNLVHSLKQLVAQHDADRIATGVGVWIDGLWLRHAKSADPIDHEGAVALIEAYIDAELARSRPV
jgi:hypothetical protein